MKYHFPLKVCTHSTEKQFITYNSCEFLGFRVEGLSKQKVFNIYEAKHFLEMGGKNRHTGETKQNLFSSRSHAIFSIEFTLDQG